MPEREQHWFEVALLYKVIVYIGINKDNIRELLILIRGTRSNDDLCIKEAESRALDCVDHENAFIKSVEFMGNPLIKHIYKPKKMTEYKFDLDKLTIGDLVLLSGGNLEIDNLFLIVNKACSVDLLEESFGDLVHIMGGFQKEVARRSDDITIALGSLRWNLNDTEGS